MIRLENEKFYKVFMVNLSTSVIFGKYFKDMLHLSSQKINLIVSHSIKRHIFESPKSLDDLISDVQSLLTENNFELNKNQFQSIIKSYRIDYKNINQKQISLIFYILLGNHEAKARKVFELMDLNNKGYLLWSQVEDIFKLINLNESLRARIIQEITNDGSDKITLSNFIDFLPEDFEKHPRSYISNHKGINFHSINKEVFINENIINSKKPALNKSIKGTSPLQIQIGFFRLLQGAAYRSFRESFSANCETHLRSYDLPYTIKDFVSFVDSAIDYYLSLGIVSIDAFTPFEDLRNSVRKLDSELENRMTNWKNIEKNKEMLMAERFIEEELDEVDNHHQMFSVFVELVLSAALHGHKPSEISLGDLEHHEMNRLRQLEEHEEIIEKEFSEKNNNNYLDSWQRVIINSENSYFQGAIVPTSYWYEEFMPLLLKASSIMNIDDINQWDNITENELDQWFDQSNSKGEFNNYGHDLREHFLNCKTNTKKCLRQAWTLTRHYLNGVQKRRERKEFGRDSGFLSQYVAFIDVYLNRNDVEKSQMRVSFPYFIGPATWRLLHTSAEIYSRMDKQNQTIGINNFIQFFKFFATMYPCPYCRYHLNRFVVRNKEVSMYPIEYLVIGGNNDKFDFDVSLESKLDELTDANSLRLFLWKLHNTVSSSIARSEDWFHADKTAFYTSRYWPSLDSEIERANLLNNQMINSKDISRIYGVIKAAVHLSILKDELHQNFNNEKELKSIFKRSKKAAKELDNSINISNFLQENYTFDPSLNDYSPHFSTAEEALARSGKFTES